MLKRTIFVAISSGLIAFFIYTPYNFDKNLQKGTITTLEENVIRDYITYKGTLKPQNYEQIKLDLPVVVDKVFVSEGEKVEKGKLLFSINKITTDEENEEILKNNTDKFEILKTFFGTVSNIETLKEKYMSLETYYYAEESGVITRLGVKEKTVTNPFDNLVMISLGDSLTVDIDILPEDISKINLGMEVDFLSPSSKDKQYKGEIISIANFATNKLDGTKLSPYITVKAKLNETDEFLIEGLGVDCKVYTGDYYTISTLPYTAINQDENGEFVYKLIDNKLVKMYVETGKEIGNLTEIKNGITKEDIIMDNSTAVNANAIIKVSK
ncbi:MAG: efflux RND transporter periplasmic adaptor subunit [Oscillospiraceae bacterium]